MLSLRSTARSLDPASQVISMRHLAQKVSLQPPISLRRLNGLGSNTDNPRLSLLTGYKISTGFLGTDHTYVTSGDPSHVWPCWGRGSGGKEICRGYGKFAVADCISQPNSHAGIVYGVTGVCHQTANRILYPARIIVSKAGGYKASSLAYGTYGSDSDAFFDRAETCGESLSARALKSGASTESHDTDMKVHSNPIYEQEPYIQKVAALYTDQMKILLGSSSTKSEESSSLQESKTESFSSAITNEERYFLLGKEFELMVEFSLGGKLDTQITNQVLKQQFGFLKEKGKMDSEFYSADLNIEKYVKEVNDLFGDMLISLPDILGKDEYEKIFDLSPSEKGFILIDPDIAVEAHKQISRKNIQPSM